MQIKFETLKDKILGCWTGKNIGGVLGAPFEGKRGTFDTDFYVQENLEGNPPPNDDLDLQLVWLAAAEKYGQQLNAELLGEYWLTFIMPDWNEYGRGKANLRAGLQPPLSGHADNAYRNSCGCFIRSEVWACLCPGNPALAVKFAYEDAVIDHSGDGMYGELFCAAVESAAFVESDRDRLVEIGLSYIPEDCLVARAVRLAQECRESGLDWKAARVRMMREVPGTFGLQGKLPAEMEDFPTTPSGNDCPNNLGLMMIAWLYGDNDFGKSLCIAVNCGEDTDCTAGTLGAIFGIIHGESRLPEQWTKPIGGIINTLCIERSKAALLGGIPQTVEALSDRILRTIPRFLDRDTCDVLAPGGYTVSVQGDLFCHDRELQFLPGLGWTAEPRSPISHERFGPMTIRRDYHMFTLYLDHPDGVYLKAGEPLRLHLSAESTPFSQQQWMNVRIHAPAAIEVRPGRSLSLPLQNTHSTPAEIPLELTAACPDFGHADILIEAALEGRHTWGAVRTRLYVKA